MDQETIKFIEGTLAIGLAASGVFNIVAGAICIAGYRHSTKVIGASLLPVAAACFLKAEVVGEDVLQKDIPGIQNVITSIVPKKDPEPIIIHLSME